MECTLGTDKEIYDFIGLDDKSLRTCHGMQVLSIKVLGSLEKNFMQARNLTYIDLIEISPYEFTWYNVWFQKCKLTEEYAVEPFFKTLHLREHYIFSRLENIDKEDFASAYLGIVLNSKWDPPTQLDYTTPPLSSFLQTYYTRKKWYCVLSAAA